ncbi:uncharacterized protein LOC108253249 [Diaphorina citri]|uniref:Uncharacterized protein LOC108253249 n=1 Tax=Diaphorina citri TaxID=121845 RepID=A0A1S4EJI7_DIACI|nr:uncharacterized protein LOC108253249 [Diaphorina citri]XP_026684228.1 uncharacterized protein LOC108253249 [Diaphorina citri]XP_026684229.1 uncharacterized protein LOC108253249 [Diaphorina citri]
MIWLRGYDNQLCRHLHDKTIGGIFNPNWRNVQHFYLDSRDFYTIAYSPRHASYPAQLAYNRIFYRRPERTQHVWFYAHSVISACLRRYARVTRTRVLPCGLFVRPECPQLSARPHGMYRVNRTKLNLIEIYKLHTNKSIKDVQTDTLFKIYRGKCVLNVTHPVYYNVQSMLTIANKSICDLVLMTDRDMYIKRIHSNTKIFRLNLLYPAAKFFAYTYLPILVRYFLHIRMHRYKEFDNIYDVIMTDFVSLNQSEHFFTFARKMAELEAQHSETSLEILL